MIDENKKYNSILFFSLSVLTILALLPLYRGYAGNSGETLLWCLRLSRVLPMKMVEPALLAGIGLIRIAIVILSYLFYATLNNGDSKRLIPSISGVVLFVFSPYQLYIAYDKVDLTDMFLWVSLLVFSIVVIKIQKTVKEKKRKLTVLLAILEICLIGFMAVTYMISYVSESQLSFEAKGYVFGEMFTSFFYQPGHPGYGVALIFAIGLWLYFWLVSMFLKDEKTEQKNKTILILSLIFSIAFMCMASINFPWDTISRNLKFLSKFIFKLESPVIFLGLSSFCLSIPAVKGISLISESKDEFASKVVPVMISFIALAIGLFLMSEYMYWQSPLGFENIER